MKTANENVIRALSRALAEARAGNVEAVAIVAVDANGAPDTAFGGEADFLPSVNLGMDMLKAQFIFRGMKASEEAAAKIRRPVGTAGAG